MFVIHLTRSHYDQLCIVAANTGNDDVVNGTNSPDPIWLETGWATRFDGGGNTHTPSDFVALYAEASQWGSEDGRPPLLFALVVKQGWNQDPNRERGVFLHHRRFSSGEMSSLTNEGLDAINSAYRNRGDWEVVQAENVPEVARKVMEKSIVTVMGLFGQGGDFFEV